MIHLTQARMDHLEELERKMACFEHYGIEHWVGYESSMDQFNKENEYHKNLSKLAGALVQVYNNFAFGHDKETTYSQHNSGIRGTILDTLALYGVSFEKVDMEGDNDSSGIAD